MITILLFLKFTTVTIVCFKIKINKLQRQQIQTKEIKIVSFYGF